MTREEAEKIAKIIQHVLSIEVGALQDEMCDRLSSAGLGWRWRYDDPDNIAVESVTNF